MWEKKEVFVCFSFSNAAMKISEVGKAAGIKPKQKKDPLPLFSI